MEKDYYSMGTTAGRTQAADQRKFMIWVYRWMFFNRVTSCWLEEPSFATGLLEREMSRIEDDQLYRVVTGMYSAQMLGTVKEKSLGLLSLEPKDENGVPITDFATRVLRDGNGSEIKEW